MKLMACTLKTSMKQWFFSTLQLAQEFTGLGTC